MVNFVIHDQNTPETKEIRLKMIPTPDGGGVDVVVCDEAGLARSYGWLLRFRPDGSLYLPQNVSPDLGLRLDSLHRISVVGGEE